MRRGGSSVESWGRPGRAVELAAADYKAALIGAANPSDYMLKQMQIFLTDTGRTPHDRLPAVRTWTEICGRYHWSLPQVAAPSRCHWSLLFVTVHCRCLLATVTGSCHCALSLSLVTVGGRCHCPL